MKLMINIVLAIVLVFSVAKPSSAQILQGILSGIVQQKVMSGVNGGSKAPKSVQNISIGDEAFSGKYRFAIDNVQTANIYQTHFNDALKVPYIISPLEGQTLYIVNCHVKNATTSIQELVFDNLLTPNTVIIDDKKTAYRPLIVDKFDGYDVHVDEMNPCGVRIYPGSVIKFAIVFGVPVGYKPTTFVYSILDYVSRNNSKSAVDITVVLK